MKVRRPWHRFLGPWWLWWLTRRRPRPDSATVRRLGPGAHPGGRGLRFSERLRDLLRPQWLTYRRDPRH